MKQLALAYGCACFIEGTLCTLVGRKAKRTTTCLLSPFWRHTHIYVLHKGFFLKQHVSGDFDHITLND